MRHDLYITGGKFQEPPTIKPRQCSDKQVTRHYITLGNCVPCQRMTAIHISHYAFYQITMDPHMMQWFRETVMVRFGADEGHFIIGEFDEYQEVL